MGPKQHKLLKDMTELHGTIFELACCLIELGNLFYADINHDL